MQQLEPGTAFAGFVIESVIGTGGMSVLYRARDPHLGRVVALKVMSSTLSGDPDFRRRFTDEAQLAAAIDHPNVVPVYAFGHDGDQLYIAMRYIPGADLRHVVASDGPLTLDRAVSLLSQIANALDELARHGMVHRDVKPDNILVTPASSTQGETAYLADFGLIRSGARSRITQAGQIVGTLAYAAPEQLRGEEVDSAADAYSLGCVLYECLTSVRPFARTNDASVIYAHLHEPPPAVTAGRPDLPPALDTVIGHALAKDPRTRYATAGDLMVAVRFAAAPSGGVGMDPTDERLRPTLRATGGEGPSSSPGSDVHPATDTAVTNLPSGAAGPGSAMLTPARTLIMSVEAGDPVDPEGSEVAAGQERRGRSRRLAVGGLVLLVAAAAVGAAWVTRSGSDGVVPPTTTTTIAVGTTVAPLVSTFDSSESPPAVLSVDPRVTLDRSLSFADGAGTAVRVTATLTNASDTAVRVDMTEVLPASSAPDLDRVSIETDPSPGPPGSIVSRPSPTSVGTLPATVTPAGVQWTVTIPAGGTASLVYLVDVVDPAPTIGLLDRWATAYPAVPTATVSVA